MPLPEESRGAVDDGLPDEPWPLPALPDLLPEVLGEVDGRVDGVFDGVADGRVDGVLDEPPVDAPVLLWAAVLVGLPPRAPIPRTAAMPSDAAADVPTRLRRRRPARATARSRAALRVGPMSWFMWSSIRWLCPNSDR